MHTTFCLPVTKRKILTSNHLLSEHHLAKLYGIFVPESHIMTALAFKIYVLCTYAVKEQVELPVFSQKKILCSAGHEYLGKPAAFVKSFRQYLGIVVALFHGIKVAEAAAVIVIIGNAVVLPLFHVCDLMHYQRRGKSCDLAEIIGVRKCRVKCSEAAHGKPHYICLIGAHCQTEGLSHISYQLITHIGAELLPCGSSCLLYTSPSPRDCS